MTLTLPACPSLPRRGRCPHPGQRLRGYVSRVLDGDQRAAIDDLIDDDRRELAPLLAPLTLLRRHGRRLGMDYLLGQVDPEPSPRELMLRNHA